MKKIKSTAGIDVESIESRAREVFVKYHEGRLMKDSSEFKRYGTENFYLIHSAEMKKQHQWMLKNVAVNNIKIYGYEKGKGRDTVMLLVSATGDLIAEEMGSPFTLSSGGIHDYLLIMERPKTGGDWMLSDMMKSGSNEAKKWLKQ